MGLIYGGIDLMSAILGGAPNGPWYRAMLDSDFGAHEPVTTTLHSLFLDGSYVSGKFSDNREIVLYVITTGNTATQTAAAVDALVAQADRQTNTLVYTPPSGLPMTFDTFRATARDERRWPGRTPTARMISLTIPAMPFGRTATDVTITASGISPIVFEAFNGTQPALTASNNTPVLVQLPTGYGWAGAPKEGTYYGSNQDTYGGTMMTVPANSQVWWQMVKTISSTDTTGRTLLSFWYLEYFMSRVYQGHGFTVSATLSSSGASSTWTLTPSWPLPSDQYGKWQKVTFDTSTTPSSTTGGGVNRSAVTGCTIRVTWTSDETYQVSTLFCLDVLTLVPPGYGDVSSTMANAYAMDGVQGSARTPVSLLVSRSSGGQMTDLLIYSKPREASSTYQPLIVGSNPYTVAKTNDLGGTYAVVATIVPGYQDYGYSAACSIQQVRDVNQVLSAANAGFETALTGFWTAYWPSYATLSQSTTQKHSGSYSLRQAISQASSVGIQSPVYNDSKRMKTPFGATVTFSAWIRSTSVSHLYYANIAFYRSNGGSTGGGQASATATTSGWTQITVTCTAPTDTQYDRMHLTLYTSDSVGTSDYQYYDDAVVAVVGEAVGTPWTTGGDVTWTAGDAYVILGEVTLPIVGTADENSQTYYVITTTTNPTFVQDYLLLDTRGQTILIGPPKVDAFNYARVSIPTTGQGTGQVSVGNLANGSDGLSPGASLRLSGGQLSFEPGSNTLVVVTTAGNSDTAVTATYQPRWLTERTV